MVHTQKKPPRKLTNYRKAVKLEAGIVKARLDGEYKFFKTRKGMILQLKRSLAKSAENISLLDAAAMGAATFIIHELILTTPELSDRAARFTASSILLGGAGILAQYAHQLGILPWDKYQAPAKLDDRPAYWLIAFFCAFLMVRHGGQLLGLLKEGAGSLSTVIMAVMA